MIADFSRSAQLFAQVLESALTQARAWDIDQGAALSALPEAVIALQMTPAKTPFYCLITANHISVQTQLQGSADATIRGEFSDWIRLASDSPNLEHFTLEGETDLARTFLQALSRLEIDWEERLSQLTGDFVAAQIGYGVRSFLHKKRQMRADLQQTLQEYLQFEIHALPTSAEVKSFHHAVDELEQALAQLESRCNALSTTSTPNNESQT
ncbi:MAG: SCP2 sterol-binding domain-containing protein [Thiotrichales bacterium]|nr:SCP2 sterol-binding domain-containing protein [Thiotrichales bacterium]